VSSPGVERKLTAIHYADVAGYSRLTGEDEEGTYQTLREYLDSISRVVKEAGGRVVHYAGDAVLADFSSVVAAVTCAVDVQNDLAARNEPLPEARRIQFRIGINLGDVVVDREDIYGDGVNVRGAAGKPRRTGWHLRFRRGLPTSRGQGGRGFRGPWGQAGQEHRQARQGLPGSARR
jgi:class 3 adenylate cyclase